MKEENKYPFTLPKGGITYAHELNKNFQKCTAVFLSKDKKKTKGKVVNITRVQSGRMSNWAIVLTFEYKNDKGETKIGEGYMDWPCTHPGKDEIVDIYYLDDNYDFVYMDDWQFIDPATHIDSLEAAKPFIKDLKIIGPIVVILCILFIIAMKANDARQILVCTIANCIVISIILKTCKTTLMYFIYFPLFLNVFALAFVMLNGIPNINNYLILAGLILIGFLLILKIIASIDNRKEKKHIP